jgi:hypothetical protein
MNRRVVMAVALLATLGATAWLSGEAPDDEVGLAREPRAGSETRSRPEPSAFRTARAPEVAWPAPPARRASEAWPFDAERAQAWVVPPPPPPPPPPRPVIAAPLAAASAVPQPPPFPYTLIGRIDDGSAVHALLSSPTQTLGVKALDVIDGQWRVEAVDARGVSLTWLPGGQRKTVAFRSS